MRSVERRLHLDELGCLALVVFVVLAVGCFGAVVVLLTFDSERMDAAIGVAALALPSVWFAGVLARSKPDRTVLWFVGIWLGLIAAAFVLAIGILTLYS